MPVCPVNENLVMTIDLLGKLNVFEKHRLISSIRLALFNEQICMLEKQTRNLKPEIEFTFIFISAKPKSFWL